MNLFEWYFRTNPKDGSSGRSEFGSVNVVEAAPGDPRIVVTIPRRKMPGVSEIVEVTSDYRTWTRDEPDAEVLSDTEDELVVRGAAGITAVRLVLEVAE